MKRLHFILLYFIICIFSGCSSKIINLTSIHQLDEAANFLMLVSDNEIKLATTCSLKSEEALNLLRPLHAKIDEESKKFINLIDENLMMTCEKDCHCGLYSDLVENTTLKEKLLTKAKSLGKSRLIECANRSAKWLCPSTLLKSLKSEVETPAEAL